MTTQPTAIAENPPTPPTVTAPTSGPSRRHPLRNALLIGGGTLLLVGGGLVAVVDATQHHESTSFSAPGIREVVIEIDAGSVTLQPESGPDVQVTTTRHWSLREGTAGHRIDNGVLTITGGCPWLGPECHVTEQVGIPAGIAVRVTTGVGGIEATNLNVPSFEAQTSAGSVTASFTTSPSDISATTNAGNVTLSVPNGSYRVNADTTVGDVNIGVMQADDARSSIVAETTAGHIDIRGR